MRNAPLLSIQLRARATALALALSVTAFAAEAIGPPRLVADQATDIDQRSSWPSEFARVGDRIVFAASDPLHGMELRGTDLDGSRVELLSDAEPGTQGSYPVLLEQIASAAFFSVRVSGERRLWVSDGTRSGTRAARDESGSTLRVGSDYSFSSRAATGQFLAVAAVSSTSRIEGLWSIWPDGSAVPLHCGEPNTTWRYSGLQVVGSRVFFIAEDPEHRSWLWLTDGSAEGTHLVTRTTATSNTAAGTSHLYFFQGWSDGDNTLWVSDGTAAGTRALARFGDWRHEAPVAFDSGPSRVYFLEYEGAMPQHLWVSDGTVNGTRRLSDEHLTLGHSQRIQGTWLDDEFVFVALVDGRRELLIHTSASSSPTLLAPQLLLPSDEPGMMTIGGRLLFPALSESGRRLELWQTDGTLQGTRAISRACQDCVFDSGWGVRVGDRAIYAHTYRSSRFSSDWITMVTDGTEAGTRVVNDSGVDPVVVDVRGSRDAARTARGLLLAGKSIDGGSEPWILDDGDATFHPLANLEPENGPALPAHLASAGGSLYWVTSGVSNDRPKEAGWVLEDRSGVVGPIPDALCSAGFVEAAADLGELLLFREAESQRFQTYPCLSTFDPSTGGWTDLTPATWTGHLGSFFAKGDLAYFQVEENNGDRPHLWQSDGRSIGTVRLPVDGLPTSFDLIAASSTHLFVRRTALGGEVYAVPRSGGLAIPIATPTQVVNYDSDLEQAVVDDRIYFTGRELPTRERLFVSDGTQTGTSVLWTSPGESEDRLLDLFAWGDQLLFLVASDRLTLWRSDGTANGTTAIADLGSLSVDPDDSLPRQAISFAGRLYFTAETDETGGELWSTDGTPAGTRPLDLVPGPAGSEPRFLAEAGGRLFFAAEADESGREVWTMDGSVAGTRRVSDIAAGSDSAAPEELVAVGTSLYFSADDGVRGRELWAIDTSADGHCVPGLRRLCLQDGRFSVEASWRDFSSHSGAATALPLSSNSGAFWFFDATNLEAVVKLLDGRAVNDHYWLFAGSLSNLGYDLQVTDTETRTTRRYTNPPGQFASLSDVEAFAAPGPARAAPARVATAERAAPPAARTSPAPCIPNATRLCLHEGRFAVEARWRDLLGNEGVAQAVALTPDTGTFWFFDEGNVELAVKLLDGREVNSRFWLFFGALSDIEYTLTATDTLTGAVREYVNPAGRLASVGDVDAF